MNLIKLIVACFCFVAFVDSSFGQTSETAVSDIKSVVKILEKSANALGYEAVQSYRPSDEWEAKEKKSLIENHAYYTLIAKNSVQSCLIPDGRIEVTILKFKNAEFARRHVDERKKYHSGNMGVNVTTSNEDGYFVEDVNGFYAAIIQDTKVIFFEDRSRAQADIVKLLVEFLAKEVY